MDTRRFDWALCCVIVTLTTIFGVIAVVIIFTAIVSKYTINVPDFGVNQLVVMNSSSSWSMNFRIYNDNKHTSYSYKGGFEVLAYHEAQGDLVNEVFAVAKIHPFHQGPTNKTVIRVDFSSLIIQNYKLKPFNLEFRGIVHPRTNASKVLRVFGGLDEKYPIWGKCEELTFGVKESIAKECLNCYNPLVGKRCWY